MRIRVFHITCFSLAALVMAPLLGWAQALTPVQAAPKPAVQTPRPTPAVPATPKASPPAKVVQPAATGTPAFPPTPPEAIVWDKDIKELVAHPGDTNILVTFSFTNSHSSSVVIKSVRPSCGCTTVELPALPWSIDPGSTGQISATLDLRNKRGVLTKSLMVDSTSGFKSLLFKVTVPASLNTSTAGGETIDDERIKNMQMTMVDRQVVFKNQDCAKCHAEPAEGKMGRDLYVAACAICHDTAHRATMVPDLKELKFPTSAPYWKYWIVNGRPGSLMPAFAKNRGGPLTDEQIDSLVGYLTETISGKPVTVRPAPLKQPRPTAVRRPMVAPPVPAPGVAPNVITPTPAPTTPSPAAPGGN